MNYTNYTATTNQQRHIGFPFRSRCESIDKSFEIAAREENSLILEFGGGGEEEEEEDCCWRRMVHGEKRETA
jgi:hypothetical protein